MAESDVTGTGAEDGEGSGGGQFIRVARSGQVPDGWVRRFFAGDVELCVARLRGRAYATTNYCSHLDCLLSAGKLVDDGIGCSCHGSVFDLETGEPVYPPATEPISTFPVREADGQIFVCIAPGDAAKAGPHRRPRVAGPGAGP